MPDACNSTSSPVLSLPITSISLPNGHTSNGIQLQIGTPPQTISALPSLSSSSTSLTLLSSRSHLSCQTFFGGVSDVNDVRCNTYAGGVFKNSTSSTYEYSGAEGSGDTLTIAGKKLEDFSFDDGNNSMATGELNFNTLGLSKDSTLLKRLVEEGVIGTRSWGYDQGTTSGWWSDADTNTRSTRVDGMLTLGGWDKSRISGETVKTALDTAEGCQIIVKVKSMMFSDEKGKIDVGASTEVEACIDPLSPFLHLPTASFTRLNTHASNLYTSSTPKTGAIFRDLAYRSPLTPPFSGNLTITLTNGFTTTIPSSELSVPYTDILENGDYGVASPDFNVLTLKPSGDAFPRLVFGKPFLSAVVLGVNYDDDTMVFGKPTHLDGGGKREKERDLVAFLPKGCGGKGENTTDTPQDTLSGPSADDGKSGLSGPQIGGIVGGLLGGLLLIGLIVFFLRRRKQNAAARAESAAYNEPRAPVEMENTMCFPKELDTDSEIWRSPQPPVAPWQRGDGDDRSFVSELSAAEVMVYEMDATESVKGARVRVTEPSSPVSPITPVLR